MALEGPKQQIADLEARISAAKKAQEPGPRMDEHYSQAQHAWRMVVEMVSGLLVGFAIGFGLDSLLGTMPIFLVVFTLLGIAAGIRLMLRSAAELNKDQAAHTGADERKG